MARGTKPVVDTQQHASMETRMATLLHKEPPTGKRRMKEGVVYREGKRGAYGRDVDDIIW